MNGNVVSVTTLYSMELADYSGKGVAFHRLLPGCHVVEKGRNPIDDRLDGEWWVLLGTNRGARAEVWQQHMRIGKRSRERFALASIARVLEG